VPIDDRSELYVVGLWLAPEMPDERRVRSGRSAFDWCVGNFVQPAAVVIADTATDPPGAVLCRRWSESEGLWYPDDGSDLAVTEEDPRSGISSSSSWSRSCATGTKTRTRFAS
jgi:hypothetical protein